MGFFLLTKTRLGQIGSGVLVKIIFLQTQMVEEPWGCF